MKKTVKYFLVFLALVALIFCYPYNFMMKVKIERIGYTKIIEAADQYLESKKATNVIDSLSPKSIKINNYGVYIKLDGFFCTGRRDFYPQKRQCKNLFHSYRSFLYKTIRKTLLVSFSGITKGLT